MKVVCDNKIPFLRGALEPYAEVVYLPGAQTTPEVVKDADAIITRTRTICNEALLKGSSVKAIATATIGFDHIDTAWCEANGIAWSNAPGCNSWSVKQYICSVLAVLAQRHGLRLDALTLGVVGVGNVGSKVADAGRALGMRVLLNDPPRARAEGQEAFTDLDTILAESDIVTVHVPLTRSGADATWHLFDAGRLARMRPSQILINSSRGPVVDNAALKETLLKGGLKAAVLDVWEGEPDLDPELVGLLDIATPHIAGYSADGKANGTTMSIRYLARQLGLPLADWTASGIPAPEQSLAFTVDAAGKTAQDVLSEAILYTYDVRRDSDALRGALGAFERLRGDYMIRREPSAFTLTLLNGTADLASRLETIGFNVI
ncbi:MAG: 4-phosphoerythronate dehydrogenase [Bacteroidales bacterium]|nr:4-phosphoerythronate dehydrogenase [Bacteroidales bacterium]